MGSLVSRTISQKTNASGFPKPGELIEITGAHALEAADRAILNTLYQFAHDSGRLGEADAEWKTPWPSSANRGTKAMTGQTPLWIA
jgi:hypothetical protein